MVIRAVEFVRRGIVRVAAPQRPKHRARDEPQSQCGATCKNFTRQSCDPGDPGEGTKPLPCLQMKLADPLQEQCFRSVYCPSRSAPVASHYSDLLHSDLLRFFSTEAQFGRGEKAIDDEHYRPGRGRKAVTETQLMKKGQWSSTKAMAHYLHHDDEAKQDAQIKRIKRRKQAAKK